MASTAISLLLKPKSRPTLSPTFLHHFSSATNGNPNPDPSPNTETSSQDTQTTTTTTTSYFSDLKASLKNKDEVPRQQGLNVPRQQFGGPRQQETASYDQIKKDLSAFRRLSAPPSGDTNNVPNQSGAKPISFQELYKRNVAAKEGGLNNDINTSKKISLDAIGESLRALRANTPKTDSQNPFSLKTFKESFTLRPNDPKNQPFVVGSPQKLPESVFSKELNQKKDGNESPAMKSRFVKMYEYKELGEKLRRLRPEGKSEGGFSVQELNERLIKLREMEEKESAAAIGNITFRELRQCLTTLQLKDKEQKLQTIDVLNRMGQTPTFMLEPPKDHLVEKYFHPDNMSSAEKLKLELQKVRDEFKMSESDCGSARVQVAQLTTKIKHLTTALHKKDKHSRKGLQGMIQQRKKLLKYLRRTDWDSYTLVLSKFGLRDNPEGKRLPKKEAKA